MRRDFTTHPCNWPGCANRVARSLWGCTHHWFLLPAELRRRIARSWRGGRGAFEDGYREALKAAREWIAQQSGVGRDEDHIAPDGKLAAAGPDA